MVQVSYAELDKRRKYNRPQAVLFANSAVRQKVAATPTAPTIPGNVMAWFPEGQEGEDWIILSDHNRSELGFSPERIENRKRMINGTMRSYYTADKYSLSLSWSELPTRASMHAPTVNTSVGTLTIPSGCMATVDGGAGGSELKNWYETHPGPFYVLLAYDDYKSVEVPAPVVGESYDPVAVQYIARGYYKHAKIMYFNSFSSDILKRTRYIESNASGTTSYMLEFDSWNISMALVEA